MRKYYVHNGIQQEGPFDIDHLKTMNIRKDTPVWYDGVSDWTLAGSIEELQSIISPVAPPPFLESKKMPPVSGKEVNNASKKSRKGVVVIISFVLITLIAFVIIMNNPNAVPGVKVELNTPKPIVVTNRADESKSGIFNARVTVYATIQNQGGDGNILVTIYVSQGGRTFDRSKSLYLAAGQSQDIDLTFEEVNYIDGKITYKIETKAE